MAGHSRKRNTKGNTTLRVIIWLVILLCAITGAGTAYMIKRSAPEKETAASEAEADIRIPETVPESSTAVTIVIDQETEAPEPEYRPEISLTFAGDILFDPGYAIMASMLQRSGGNPDISTAFDRELLDIMRDSDIFMVNNEFPYSERGEPLPEKEFTFRARPEYAKLLNDMGADLVSLANNHVNDHGRDAMTDTFDTLEAAGIPYVGAGRNIEEASSPYITEVEGVRIAFLSATQIERLPDPDTVEATQSTPGVFRCLDNTRLLERIGEAKQNADIVAVYIHWGTEGTEIPDSFQTTQAPEMAEAGADIIIGDHPHVLQRIDLIDGVPVIYSLGNYLFNSGTQDTCLVQAVVDTKEKKISGFRFIPAYQSGCRTKLLTGEEKQRVIEYMNSLSDKKLDEEGYLPVP